MPAKNLENYSEVVMKNMLHNVDALIASSEQYSTIQEFEKAANISIGYLSRLKKAARNPSLAMLLRIANALNVSLDALLYSHFVEAKTDNETVQYLTYFARQTMSSTIRWTKLHPPEVEKHDSVLYEVWYSPYDDEMANPNFAYKFLDTGSKSLIKWEDADKSNDFVAEISNGMKNKIYARLMEKDNASRLDIILIDEDNSPELLCQISSKETTYPPLIDAAKTLSNAIQQQMCNTTFNPRVKEIMSRLQKQVPLMGNTEESTSSI